MLLLAKNDDFRDFRRHEGKLSRLALAPMNEDGGKCSSPIFDDLAHFSIVENL
jgi:hypothetical protein